MKSMIGIEFFRGAKKLRHYGGGGRQKKYRNRQNNYIDYTKKRDKGRRG